MKIKQTAILWILVILLCGHSVHMSRQLSAMSDEANIQRLRAGSIELVQPSGLIVGSINAGNDGGCPEIKLKQKDSGHFVTLGFAANGTGPYLELISGFSIGKEAISRIEIGAFSHYQHGLRVTGGDAEQYPPITLGWVTGRAGTNANRYLFMVPETRTQ